MGCAADTTGGDAELCFLRQRDQLRDVFGLDFIVENNDVRDVAGQSDRREIFQWIVAEFGLHKGIDCQWSVRADQQGVTVGRRARHGFSADAAAGTTTIVDYPNALEMRSPTRRPTMSALPPAANGTIRRIGRSGYFANASRPSSTRTGVNRRLAISLRREIDMEVLGFLRRGRQNCLDRRK